MEHRSGDRSVISVETPSWLWLRGAMPSSGLGHARLATIVIGVCLLSGCALLELQREADRLNRNVVIHGVVKPEGWSGEPLVVVLSRDATAGEEHQVEYRLRHEPGSFYFWAEPGTYELAAFEDRSGKLRYRAGDPVLLGAEPVVATGAQASIEANLEGQLATHETLSPRFDIAVDSDTTEVEPAFQSLGRVVPMDAPEMSLELGHKGMWEPEEYMEKVQAGLFLLEPFDPNRVPVLFVHGIGGAPIQFETLADGLDRERFQPWFFAYPSIFPLQMVADALNQMLDIYRRENPFDRLHLVAHSMGGLVSRAYLNEYAWGRHDYDVDTFVTLASPFGGESGASMYPAADRGEAGALATWIAETGRTEEGDFQHVAWTDMAPESAFLANLYEKPLPTGTDYHLLFAFLADASLGPPSDGTVSLKSQLRPEAQAEATGLRGFAAGHDEVLSRSDSVRFVHRLLEQAERR